MGSISDESVYLLSRDGAETERYPLVPAIWPIYYESPQPQFKFFTNALLNSLNNQHRFLVEISGNILHPSIPAKNITAVADLGTGTGIWLEDIANCLPNESVYLHGFDISSAQYPSGSEIRRPGRNPIPLSVHDALHPFPVEHHARYDLVHIRLLTAGLKYADYATVLANARDLLKPNGYLQWEEVDHTAFCTDSIPESPAITKLRQSVIEAMLKLGLWPFAPQHVHHQLAAGGFRDIRRATYTTIDKEGMRAISQKWVAGVMRALVPASMVVTGEARDERQAKEVVERLVGEFDDHCLGARVLVNFGVTVGRRCD